MADDPLKPKRPADAAVDPLRDNLKAVAGTDPERTALLNRKDGKAPLQHAIKAVEAALSGDRSDTKMATDDVAPTLAVKGAGQKAPAPADTKTQVVKGKSRPERSDFHQEPVVGWLPVGTRVNAGDRVAGLAATSWHCGSSCLHWGVRVGAEYVDPLRYLGPVRVVLLPMD